MGVASSPARKSLTSWSVFLSVVPLLSARSPAAWIAGPSAIGSVKGMPTSITSAPAAGRAFRMSSEVARSGSPAITKVTRAARPSVFRAAKRASIRVDMRLRSLSASAGLTPLFFDRSLSLWPGSRPQYFYRLSRGAGSPILLRGAAPLTRPFASPPERPRGSAATPWAYWKSSAASESVVRIEAALLALSHNSDSSREASRYWDS